MAKTLLSSLLFFLIIQIVPAQTFSGPIQIDNNVDAPTEIAAGDLDNDGDIDLVVGTYPNNGDSPYDIIAYLNDGDGNFTIKPISNNVNSVIGLLITNIDNEHGQDIVATSATSNKLVYFLSDGSGGFSSEIVVDDTIGSPGQVVAGDINQDGHIDLVTMSYDNNESYWYSGDGNGNFTRENIIENSGSGPYYAAIGDLDGDTDLDVIIGYYDTQSIEVFYNQYIENGSSAITWIQDTTTVTSSNGRIIRIGIEDITNDGTMEIIMVDESSNGKVAYYEKPKDESPTEYILVDNSLIDRKGGYDIADINNDGLNDVIVGRALLSGTEIAGILWFEGVSNSAPKAEPNIITYNSDQYYDLVAADFDGDTDIDIAVPGKGRDSLRWFENQLNPLSIKDQGLNDLKIYPNPTNNHLYLKSSVAKILEITVYDTLGKAVITRTLQNNESLDVSKLHQGIYLLKFKDYQNTFKFVKS